MDLHRLLKVAEKTVADNSPAILSGLGVAGVVYTAYLTGVASVRAARSLEASEPLMSKKELVRTVAPEYVPAVGMGCVTISCIVLSHRISTRRATAMMAAYSVTQQAFDEYRHQVAQTLSDRKELAIRDAVAQEKVSNTPGSREVIFSGKDVLCYEQLTGRYFSSDMEKIRSAVNDINHTLNSDGYASLSDFFALIGLSPTAYSEEVGWRSDKLLEIHFSTVLSEDNAPCLAIGYSVDPIRNYYRFG